MHSTILHPTIAPGTTSTGDSAVSIEDRPPVLARIPRLVVDDVLRWRIDGGSSNPEANKRKLEDAGPSSRGMQDSGSNLEYDRFAMRSRSSELASGRSTIDSQPANLSSLVVNFQTWIRPLARLIVLAALLTAAGLCYLLIESAEVKRVPPSPPATPAAGPAGPQLTANSPPVAPNLATALPLREALSSTAGSASNSPAPSLAVQPPASHVPGPPDRQRIVSPIDAVASHETAAGVGGAPAVVDTPAYPRTPHIAPQIGPAGPDDPQGSPSADRPVAVAELTGDIQPVMTK